MEEYNFGPTHSHAPIMLVKKSLADKCFTLNISIICSNLPDCMKVFQSQYTHIHLISQLAGCFSTPTCESYYGSPFVPQQLQQFCRSDFTSIQQQTKIEMHPDPALRKLGLSQPKDYEPNILYVFNCNSTPNIQHHSSIF